MTKGKERSGTQRLSCSSHSEAAHTPRSKRDAALTLCVILGFICVSCYNWVGYLGGLGKLINFHILINDSFMSVHVTKVSMGMFYFPIVEETCTNVTTNLTINDQVILQNLCQTETHQ